MTEAAEDSDLPLKTRIFMINFLGLLNDPGSFKALQKILLYPKNSDVLRAQAASVLFDAPVGVPARRRVFCEFLSQKNTPPLTLSQVLFEVSRLGCRDVNLLKAKVESFGSEPEKQDKILALLAIQGMGESFSLKASAALWNLFDFFNAGSPERREILKALLKQSFRNIPPDPDGAFHAEAALRSESR